MIIAHLSIAVLTQPLIVALTDTHHEKLNQTIVDGMQKCNDVSPNVLGSIYEVIMGCHTRVVGQILYVYMERRAGLILLEVQVFERCK